MAIPGPDVVVDPTSIPQDASNEFLCNKDKDNLRWMAEEMCGFQNGCRQNDESECN